MKKGFFLFFVFLSAALSAQTSKKVTGPKAKNAKIWNQKKPKTIITVNSFKKEKVSSPELKNQKIWKRKISDKKIVLQTKARKKLQGPKAKNLKVWEK